MTSALGRRDFLRGGSDISSTPTRPALRPPWSALETAFTSSCTRCGDCLTACSENIIHWGLGGFPEVNFTKGECTFCGDCAMVCGSGALRRVEDAPPWSLKAWISDLCISAKGVSCRACAEQCEAGSISFRLAVGGLAIPALNEVTCTGCGACVAPCPVSAVAVGASQ